MKNTKQEKEKLEKSEYHPCYFCTKISSCDGCINKNRKIDED